MPHIKNVLSLLAVIILITFLSPVSAATFTPGNLLVTENNDLMEYTITGQLIQTLSVPHPDTTRHDATDVVIDRYGRAHVLNIAPFSSSYISTYDPIDNSWIHNNVTAGLGNVSDGDLSLFGDYLITKNEAISILNFSRETLFVPGRSVGEISFGQDGFLYALDSGSPRPGVRRLDPDVTDLPLEVVHTLELRDPLGFRLDARGIAVQENGDIYAADWDGSIYKYDQFGSLEDVLGTTTSNLLDIDLSSTGLLAVGSRFGNVVITDTEFSTFSIFSAGSDLTYVGFVSTPIPIPSGLWLFMSGIGLFRVVFRQRKTNNV